MKLSLMLLALITAGAARLTAERLEIAGAAQPQLCAASDGSVWLTYGHGGAIFAAQSGEDGSFKPAVQIAAIPNLMLGNRRGPRIAAHGDTVTVTVIGNELLAYTSTDAGRNWSGPVTVNDVPGSAHEGLHDLAIAPDGKLFVTWLDLRSGAMQLWGAQSTDAGRTWVSEPVYRSPDKSICECCHPSAMFDAEGNLAVMWRNSVSGSRDLWMAIRPKGSAQLSSGEKLGSGTWALNGCPMDGGRIIAQGGGKFASVWQRAGEVYYAPLHGDEVRVGKGKQPVALARGDVTLVLWQDGSSLVSTTLGSINGPLKTHAAKGRFPVLVARPGAASALLAYEVDMTPEITGAAPTHGEHAHGKASPPKLTNIVIEPL
ncbi:MAG: sialidase family protein [Opitutus sp.]